MSARLPDSLLTNHRRPERPRGAVPLRRLWGGLLGLALVLAATGVASGAIPVNTWVGHTPAPCSDPICKEGTQIVKPGDHPPEFRAFSGATAVPGYIFIWGGGHHTWQGNDIDAYDIANDRWVQFTEAENADDADFMNGPDAECPNITPDFWSPSVSTAGTETTLWDYLTCDQKQNVQKAENSGSWTGFLSPLGRPMNKHTYQQMVWRPSTAAPNGVGEFCVLYNGLYCYSPPTDGQGNIVAPTTVAGDNDGPAMSSSANDPTQPDGAWRKLGPGFRNRSSISAHTLNYWPVGDRLFACVGAGDGLCALFNETTSSWDVIATGMGGRSWSEGYSQYLPTVDKFLVELDSQFWVVDPNLSGAAAVTDVAEPPFAFTSSLSLEWAPEISRVLFWGATDVDGDGTFSSTLYTWDPATKTWGGEMSLMGVPPRASIAKLQPRYDRLERDPKSGRYFVVADDRGGFYMEANSIFEFRLDSNALSIIPTSCPYDQCMGGTFQHGTLAAALAAAQPGETIGVADGSYSMCAQIDKPVTIKPISGRPVFRNIICNGKAVLFVSHRTGTVTLEGIEVSNLINDKGVWLDNGAGRLIIRDSVFHDLGMGVFSGIDAEGLEIYNSEFYGMQDHSELAHYIYCAETRECFIEGNYLHENGGLNPAEDGHFIKAASVNTRVNYNYIVNDSVWTDIAAIQIWGCGQNEAIGNIMLEDVSANAPNGWGQMFKVQNRGDGSPNDGDPHVDCPAHADADGNGVPDASVVIAYNNYKKVGGGNTSFVDAGWNTITSAAEPLDLTIVNNIVAIGDGRLVRQGTNVSENYPDNQWTGNDSSAFFADGQLRTLDPPRAAVASPVTPAFQYRHPRRTATRPAADLMGAYGQDQGVVQPDPGARPPSAPKQVEVNVQ